MEKAIAEFQTQLWASPVMKRRLGDVAMWIVKLGFLAALSYAASDIPSAEKNSSSLTDTSVQRDR